MITTLKSIPRIGEKTAKRLIEHFGSEKRSLEAIVNHDIASLSEIEGMTEKSAISLVLETMAINEGAGVRNFLKTNEAFEFYERLIELVKGFAHTDHARSKLSLYFPYPSRKKEKIILIQEEIQAIIQLANKLDEKELSSLLSRVKPLKTNYSIPVIRDRVIIATNTEEFEAAKKFPVSVQLASDAREIPDIARGYSYVILGAHLAGRDFPDDLDIDFMDIKKAEAWQVAPEKELSFFSRNLESITCAIEILKNIRQYLPDFCGKIKPQELTQLSSGLMNLSSDDTIKSGVDTEIDRCKSIFDRLNDAVATAESAANTEFGALIEKSSITVKGFDLLTAMDGSINRMLEKEIKEKYNTVASNAMRGVVSGLGLTPNESQYVNNFFGDELSYPIKVNIRAVEGLKNHLLRTIASRKIVILRNNARSLSNLKETAQVLVRDVLDLDVGYSIACFAKKFALNMPRIQSNNGIGIKEGMNIFLSNVVPIDYTVGNSSMNSSITKLKNAHVVLLSGVNSGGKTSTLDLIAQIVILAHMGFPVPARECEVGLVEEFYYFGKSKGTMDAGAFESTIRDFAAVANSNAKIVLADEMESITEPGASAKIISGILEELEDNNGLGVFVSHLAESIMKNTTYEIRVDGIEAKGLDENLNLIVDRNPRYNYLARSTPELIVERLARKHEDVEFYGKLLKKFK
ncbi:MAG: helix-hairpin-helix domain-containing protein [Candidatus Methanoperedens sp.]|nr:helix-hairpin-helix domain-containing protein [Candidatus Methanoperedens sp.]